LVVRLRAKVCVGIVVRMPNIIAAQRQTKKVITLDSRKCAPVCAFASRLQFGGVWRRPLQPVSANISHVS
jgi:hypothetical protein